MIMQLYGELKEPEFSPLRLNESYCRGILQQYQVLAKVRVRVRMWLKIHTINGRPSVYNYYKHYRAFERISNLLA